MNWPSGGRLSKSVAAVRYCGRADPATVFASACRPDAVPSITQTKLAELTVVEQANGIVSAIREGQIHAPMFSRGFERTGARFVRAVAGILAGQPVRGPAPVHEFIASRLERQRV